MSLAIRGTSARQKSDEPLSSIGQAANRHVVNEEALSRLLTLDIGELRQQWRGLYKTQAPRHFSRELLVRAVAYRMQELARGGLRPEPLRQLRRIAQQFKEIGEARIRARPELKKSDGQWSQCPYFAGCQYIQTRKATYSAPFVILVHSHLAV